MENILAPSNQVSQAFFEKPKKSTTFGHYTVVLASYFLNFKVCTSLLSYFKQGKPVFYLGGWWILTEKSSNFGQFLVPSPAGTVSRRVARGHGSLEQYCSPSQMDHFCNNKHPWHVARWCGRRGWSVGPIQNFGVFWENLEQKPIYHHRFSLESRRKMQFWRWDGVFSRKNT